MSLTKLKALRFKLVVGSVVVAAGGVVLHGLLAGWGHGLYTSIFHPMEEQSVRAREVVNTNIGDRNNWTNGANSPIIVNETPITERMRSELAQKSAELLSRTMSLPNHLTKTELVNQIDIVRKNIDNAKTTNEISTCEETLLTAEARLELISGNYDEAFAKCEGIDTPQAVEIGFDALMRKGERSRAIDYVDMHPSSKNNSCLQFEVELIRIDQQSSWSLSNATRLFYLAEESRGILARTQGVSNKVRLHEVAGHQLMLLGIWLEQYTSQKRAGVSENENLFLGDITDIDMLISKVLGVSGRLVSDIESIELVVLRAGVALPLRSKCTIAENQYKILHELWLLASHRPQSRRLLVGKLSLQESRFMQLNWDLFHTYGTTAVAEVLEGFYRTVARMLERTEASEAMGLLNRIQSDISPSLQEYQLPETLRKRMRLIQAAVKTCYALVRFETLVRTDQEIPPHWIQSLHAANEQAFSLREYPEFLPFLDKLMTTLTIVYCSTNEKADYISSQSMLSELSGMGTKYQPPDWLVRLIDCSSIERSTDTSPKPAHQHLGDSSFP